MNCSVIGTKIQDSILGTWYKCTRCSQGGWGGVENVLPTIICLIDKPPEKAATTFKELPCVFRNPEREEKVVGSCCSGHEVFERIAYCRLLDVDVRLEVCLGCDKIKGPA